MPRIELNATGNTPLSKLSHEEKQRLYEAASGLVSERRLQLIDSIASQRTRHITVVLEDVYQSHNAAAVLRSCDCFGVQDVHVVEQNNPFNPAGDVAVGSSKWVDYYPHKDIQSAYNHLRSKGYRIVATTPHPPLKQSDNQEIKQSQLITDLDISTPVALIFGTELTGLSTEAIDLADEYVKIPMYGFTESFNISVSVALSLFNLTERLRHSQLNTEHLSLNTEELLSLKLHWLSQTIRDGEKVLESLLPQIKK